MKSSIYQSLAIKTLSFFLIWLLLSQSFDLLHMGMGILAAFGVAWFNTDRTASGLTIPRLRIVWYFPWLVGRIIQSGFHLSVLILHPALPIDPKWILHRTKLRTDAGIVLLGNSITLTPGTITVEVDSQNLLVHAMDDKSADDVTSFRIEQQIAGLFGEKGME
ncbi:MAG: Na+/H+ antiporter subunit E [Planctomycetota bacterium]|nr:Na+/H+ antiporter subunit E [Planctomycetota bacterium]